MKRTFDFGDKSHTMDLSLVPGDLITLRIDSPVRLHIRVVPVKSLKGFDVFRKSSGPHSYETDGLPF